MSDLFLLSNTLEHDPRIAAWFTATEPHRLIVRPWFERMRKCGADVREQFHDGCPTACVGEAPFAYVGAFKAHSSVGFFRGSELRDPARLLEGSGKNMRHVKLRPGKALDENGLATLIDAAYQDMRRCLGLARSK